MIIFENKAYEIMLGPVDEVKNILLLDVINK